MSRFTPISLFLLALLLSFSTGAWANITNEGSDAVRLKMKRNDSRILFYILYPGQTTLLPDDVTAVTVAPLGGIRGDETVNVKIIDSEGNEKNIVKYNDTVIIGEELSKSSSATPLIKNLGNTVVRVTVKRSKTSDMNRVLYPEDTVNLPDDVKEVLVPVQGRLWGDERIAVEVTLKDGTTETISSFGGKVDLEDDNT